MAKSGFHVGGIDALRGALTGAKIASASSTNIKAAASHLEGEIKDRAPVDLGHLEGSYGYVTETSDDHAIAYVGTNVPYAVHQEYGTVHQSGTPHVRPALDANRETLVNIMAANTLREAFEGL